MKKRILTLVIVFTLLTKPEANFAQSYIYLSQDAAAQRGAVAGVENYVVSKWGDMVPSALTWKADSAIRPYVVSAINNWLAVMPSQTWVEVSSYPNIEFKNSPCPTGAPGCADFTSWAGYWTSNTSTPNWNWIWHVNVYATFSTGYTENAKIGTIAHEIGHIYGLYNRYSGNTCGSDISIMDANINSGGTINHCDNLTGPSSLDDQRASDYYAVGEFDTFQSTLVSGVLKYTWYDLAWADNRHGLYFYYLNGSTWTQYAGPIGTAVDVGLQKQIEARQFIMTINPNNYGAPHGRYYMACGWPIFPSWYGTWKCSNTTWWP